jgi:hypothetical protein
MIVLVNTWRGASLVLISPPRMTTPSRAMVLVGMHSFLSLLVNQHQTPSTNNNIIAVVEVIFASSTNNDDDIINNH